MAHGDWALAYNDAGRLVSAAHALTGVSLAYEYNALGQRVRKTVDDNGAVTETRFLYDLDGHLIAETDTAGALLREYLLLGDTPVGFVAQAQGASGRSLFFVHADHLDTARVITDASGQVAWQALREPFGATTVLAGNTLDWPLRFPGQYLDSETGWHYNYFRDYEPEVGRYLQSDPIGLWGGVNTYAYSGNSPLVFADIFGAARENWAEGSGGDDGRPIVVVPPKIIGNESAENVDGSGVDMWTPSWGCTLQCAGGEPVDIEYPLGTEDSVNASSVLDDMYPGSDQLDSLMDRTDPEDWLDCP